MSRLGFFRSIARDFRALLSPYATPIPIASILPGTRARIEGRVESADATVVSPYTGRAGVLALMVLAEKQRNEGPRGGEIIEWVVQIRAVESVPFWIVDDAGGRVFVEPTGATVKLPLDDVGEHPRVNDENPVFSAYLRRHGVLSTQFMGIAGEHRFHEAVVAPGERIGVSGMPVLRRIHVAAGAIQTYRDGAVEVPVFAEIPDQPLLILPLR